MLQLLPRKHVFAQHGAPGLACTLVELDNHQRGAQVIVPDLSALEAVEVAAHARGALVGWVACVSCTQNTTPPLWATSRADRPTPAKMERHIMRMGSATWQVDPRLETEAALVRDAHNMAVRACRFIVMARGASRRSRNTRGGNVPVTLRGRAVAGSK